MPPVPSDSRPRRTRNPPAIPRCITRAMAKPQAIVPVSPPMRRTMDRRRLHRPRLRRLQAATSGGDTSAGNRCAAPISAAPKPARDGARFRRCGQRLPATAAKEPTPARRTARLASRRSIATAPPAIGSESCAAAADRRKRKLPCRPRSNGLSSNQSTDGHWDADRFGAGRETMTLGQNRNGAGAQADTAMTGLGLLALLGSGNTHREGRYADNVRRGLELPARRARQPTAISAGKPDVGALCIRTASPASP